MASAQKDYEEFLKLLNKHKAKYCVVGAYALAFYAVPRYTKDIDVFIEQSGENARRVLLALKEFGFERLGLSEEDLMEPNVVVQLGYEPLRIDILTSIDGCKFSQVWSTKKIGRYGRQKVFFIGREQLIKNKKATNRLQDRADLDLLRKKRRPK